MDLNINNYDLDDILNLFKLDYQFDIHDLKKAKKIMLKLHPDKSRLDPKYFLFFKKAYLTLVNIFKFREKKYIEKDKVYNSSQFDNEHVNTETVLNHFSNMSDFNKWFNKKFESVKIHDNEVNTGYGSWFKSDENINDIKVTNMNDFSRVFNEKKRECRDLIVKKDIIDVKKNSGSNILRETQECYSSDIFSKLPYEDLKKAHTETVVPVTIDDFNNKEKFNNVQSLKNHRSNMDVGSLSIQQSREMLLNRQIEENKFDTQRAYKILKQDEEIHEKHNQWNTYLNVIKN